MGKIYVIPMFMTVPENNSLAETTERMRRLREDLAQKRSALQGGASPTERTVVSTKKSMEHLLSDSKISSDLSKREFTSTERTRLGQFLIEMHCLDKELYLELQQYARTLFQTEEQGMTSYKSGSELRGDEMEKWAKILEEILENRELTDVLKQRIQRYLER